ncbi:MAG: hypothetical protein ACRC51_05775 [Cetobacterium sp.]
MEIINFEYKDHKTSAILLSKKGTKFKATFDINGLQIYLPDNKNCPENAKEFIKNYLLSKEVFDFSGKWGNSLPSNQKWIGAKIAKALYEFEKGERYFSYGCYPRKSAKYKPIY